MFGSIGVQLESPSDQHGIYISHICVNMATFALKKYVLAVLPIEIPFLIKEYISLTSILIVWAGVAGLDHMRLSLQMQKVQN